MNDDGVRNARGGRESPIVFEVLRRCVRVRLVRRIGVEREALLVLREKMDVSVDEEALRLGRRQERSRDSRGKEGPASEHRRSAYQPRRSTGGRTRQIIQLALQTPGCVESVEERAVGFAIGDEPAVIEGRDDHSVRGAGGWQFLRETARACKIPRRA
jgi:hypothetical protein